MSLDRFKISDEEMKAGTALLLLLDGRVMTSAEILAEMPEHSTTHLHARMYAFISSGHIQTQQFDGHMQTFRLEYEYEKLGGVLVDGRILYGPCCYNPTYTCMCQIFGDYLRERGEHPCASQRRRDIVCRALNRESGGLLPSTDGTTVYFRPVEEGQDRVVVHEVLHELSWRAWAEIGTIAADSRYDYQPGFCQVTVTP